MEFSIQIEQEVEPLNQEYLALAITRGGLMLKITGLDKLQKELKDAERALKELDGELGVVNFDPHDPASIEAAVHSVNRMIDERVGAYASNSIIGPLVDQMKEKYRENILQKSAEARLKSDEDE